LRYRNVQGIGRVGSEQGANLKYNKKFAMQRDVDWGASGTPIANPGSEFPLPAQNQKALEKSAFCVTETSRESDGLEVSREPWLSDGYFAASIAASRAGRFLP
jgi:hypothetical protein